MALMKSTDESGAMADINITPFVDVMLVLLVIFMVTAPLMENGIPVQLPKASAKALPPKEGKLTTILNLTKEGRILIDREEVTLATLAFRLQQLYKNREDKEIYIRADETLPYGIVAQAMATVKNAGIHKIGLATVPEEGKAINKK